MFLFAEMNIFQNQTVVMDARLYSKPSSGVRQVSELWDTSVTSHSAVKIRHTVGVGLDHAALICGTAALCSLESWVPIRCLKGFCSELRPSLPVHQR